MKKSFTLTEILIVVAILGILAAIILPTFQSHTQQAKESAAKDNLRVLRNAIELYTVRHNDIPPGYPSDDPTQTPTYLAFLIGVVNTGKYLPEMPENPFNGKRIFKIVLDNEDFPSEPVETDTYGWLYKPQTKTIKLNWSGTDSAGMTYFNY
jgi:prepilin-type N-terminal cleavage/methylation domain-containing protein